MERRTLSITGYGIYVVSIASLKRFLSSKNVKSKNILQVFQNNPDLYFESLSEGIWIPILPIDCIDYDIMVGSDEIAQGNWETFSPTMASILTLKMVKYGLVLLAVSPILRSASLRKLHQTVSLIRP